MPALSLDDGFEIENRRAKVAFSSDETKEGQRAYKEKR
jgi:hypothetical protein